ncbi:hypothetical protein [Streptomyces pseudovenezuelae]|uniref:Secreted protein n=1 Tax=Streptomyces pseudovenezuelae TaxID=67350 RepID=A0ABT6LQI9_9ACTN|nr:hypothetical protein [Streptomyces pseudovenezuelae]MDH6218536.1 hypothetical protein [Streptomyces pseudovenezuelae]
MNENENEPVDSVGEAAPAPEVGPVDEASPAADAAPVAESGPVGEVGPVEPAGTATAPEPSARNPRRRRRVVAVTAGVLLAAAVVAGVVYTVITVRNADRDAEAPEWKFPSRRLDGQGAGSRPKVASVNGLGGMLVPFGTDGWSRGPDLGEFGSDAELSGAQASALRKESLSDLPRSQRTQLQKQYDKHPIKGMAMRSYLNSEPSSVSDNEGIFAVSVLLTRMDSQAQAKNLSALQNALFESLDVFRKGPAVKGYKDAKCFLPPKDDKADLSGMICSARIGDVMVTVTADGPKPLDTKGVALLTSEQLDRIAEPGEAV